MKYVPAHDFGVALCHLCGLDPDSVLDITVRARPGDFPQIEVRMMARSEDGRVQITDGAIEEIHAHYELVPKADA